MSVEPVEVAPDLSFGCTVADVLRLLPHVSVGAVLHTAVLGEAVIGETVPGHDPSDPYATPQVRRLTVSDVEAFIQRVGSRVMARVYRYEQIPERTREHIVTMARDLVATGAAHYVQAALHPGSTGVNNGSAYAERLWERFQTDLDDVRAEIDRELEDPSAGSGGGASGGFPAPLFPDEMVF